MGIQWSTAEYSKDQKIGIGSSEVVRELLWNHESWERGYNGVQPRVREWELSQLLVEDNHGKLVVEEELEVSLWRLSVWLEDLDTVRLF
jgi:hypothetical protein